MNYFQSVVIVLSLGFLSGSCEHANRRNSDERYAGPNGLSNNGHRCYANAVLQLLAACFPKEIEKIPQFSDRKKENMRLNLCTVVNHINAKKKRNADNKKVQNAVRSLTDQFCPKDANGGFAADFIEKLIETLKFLPDHRMFLVRQDTFNHKDGAISDFQSKTLYSIGAFAAMMENQSISLCEKTKYLSDRALESYWEWKKTESMPSSHEQSSSNFEEIIKKLNKNRNAEQQYVVRFTKLEKKLSPGTKFMVSAMHQKGKKQNFTLPYEEKPGCWQKFDLVGFVVYTGTWHYVAYIKREGIWYKANDSVISRVEASNIDQELKECSKFLEDSHNAAKYRQRSLSVYEARA